MAATTHARKRGRPSRQDVFRALDQARRDLQYTGGLPEPAAAPDIWKDIWYEETHNSTAIEGNSMAKRQVKALLEDGRVAGGKEFREHLEVQAYADAAMWVYNHALHSYIERPETLISESDVRRMHEMVVRPVWRYFPPEGPVLEESEGPGGYRKKELEDLRPGLTPIPFVHVPTQLANWLASTNDPMPDDCHVMERLADVHAAFERIHPFRDGNGRVGRLILNFLLVRYGYPPAVIYKAHRQKYLRALERADNREPGELAELIARSVKHSIERFLLPALAGPLRMVPLAALADERLSHVALAAAAKRGRLQAHRMEQGWYSTRQWVDEYAGSRKRGRKKAA